MSLMSVNDQALTIRSASRADAASLCDIYNHYVTNTAVTFEEQPVSIDGMGHRVESIVASSLPWLVAEVHQEVLGYAYATSWRPRSAYRYSVEVTVYVRHGLARRGIGSSLYNTLLPSLRTLGVHAVIAGISLPNQASVALHERFGFHKVAHFEEVGFKHNRWVDVGYWQRVMVAEALDGPTSHE